MASSLGVRTKDPAAKKDYSVDWSDWMATGDAIAGVEWTVPVGLTSLTPSNNDTVATVWLQGGTDGEDYLVACKITTAAGRIDEKSFTLRVREQ